MKKRQWFGWPILLIVFLLFTAGYIFHNSYQNGEESNRRSEVVAEMLQPVLDPRGRMGPQALNELVRKLAHVTEFFVFGGCLGALTARMGAYRHRYYICFPLLISVLTALADEYVQSFTGRTSRVEDVWIDFAGACCGIAVVFVIAAIWKSVRKGKERKKCDKNRANVRADSQ